MKSKLNEERKRMLELAGILKENESANEKVQVWFDLDGVLADFENSITNDEETKKLRADYDDLVDAEYPEYKGLSNDEIKAKFKSDLEKDPNNERVRSLKKVFNKYNKQVFRTAGRDGFFINLELMPKAKEMVKKAQEITGVKPNVLTAPIGNENDPNNPVVKEKKEWVNKHFGDLVDHIEVTVDKGRVVNSENDILIDDRQKYIDKFTSRGGSGILFKNPDDAMSKLEDLYKSLTY